MNGVGLFGFTLNSIVVPKENFKKIKKKKEKKKEKKNEVVKK